MNLHSYIAGCLLSLGIIALTATAETLPPEDTPTTTGDTVVLLHGLGRGESAMWLMAHRIEKAGFNVIRVGYDSLDASPEAIVSSVTHDIDACCKALPGSVHFVGHSLGGLLIRAYLAENLVPNRGRVVLIGTPNSGTPLVDRYRDSWWMELAGPTANALGTGPGGFPQSLPPPDYPVGIIAGIQQGVLVKHIIPEASDGMVPVESTKLEGMVDFIIIETGHSFMRYDDEVAAQTIAFLMRGRFDHSGKQPSTRP